MYPPPYIYHTNQQIHLGRPLVSSTLQQIPRREASRLQRGTSGDPHCWGYPKRITGGGVGVGGKGFLGRSDLEVLMSKLEVLVFESR